MPVNSPRSDYTEMRVKWDRLRDCYNGRDAILKAGVKYVPLLPAKDTAQNEDYRRRGNFYNALMRTVQGMTGAVFQEPPEVEFPETFKPYLDDVTLTSVPFEMFAQESGREVILAARYGVLVDMPMTPATDNRPYLLGFKAEQIINWRTTRMLGQEMLTLVVLRECYARQDPKDLFLSEEADQYRVLRLTPTGCTVEVWREKSKDDHTFMVFTAETPLMRRGEVLPFIPFVFICAANATPELEDPPLIDLADVNLGHWRNSVDHEYGLHLVALPTPWVSGSKAPGDAKDPLPIGPSKVWELELQGQAGMLEFSGEGLAALVTAMEEKKKQMAALGGRLLEDSAVVQETASAVRMRHTGENATLRTIAQSLEIGLKIALQMFAWWAGTEAKPGDTTVGVELNKEYLNVKATALDVQAALTALQADEISFETWYEFLQDGGWAREGVNAEQELKDIQKRIDLAKKNEPPPPPIVPPPVPVKKIVRDASGNVTEIHG